MLKNKKVYIYALVDPLTKEIRYIGKTVNLKKRLQSHLEDTRKTKKVSWIKSIIKKNLVPEIEVIDEVLETEWEFWERHYISLYKSWGFRLTNSTEGGDGNSCWQKKHKEETKKKISLAHTGKPKSEAHKLSLKCSHGQQVIVEDKNGNRTVYRTIGAAATAIGEKSSVVRTLLNKKKEIIIKDIKIYRDETVQALNYPKERKKSPRIKEKIFQLNKEGVVIGIWNNVPELLRIQYNEDTKTAGAIHWACRSLGQRLVRGCYWFYEKDLNKQYKIGEKVEGILLKKKEREVYIVNLNGVVVNKFTSITAASKFLKVSDVTVGNYLKTGKALNNMFFIKEKKETHITPIKETTIGYYDVFYTKEQLLSKSKEELENILEEIFNKVKDLPFPYHHTKESLDKVIEHIQKSNLKDSYIEGEKTFKGQGSFVGNSYLKALFKNYFHSNYKGGKSPIECWNDKKILKKVIAYRIGLNKSRETFDISLHTILNGIRALRSNISFFKPVVAASIYKHFLQDKESPIVIDPCAGFGGRMLGFTATFPKGKYIGIEPNPETFKYLNILKQQILNILPDVQIELYNCKLEDYNGIKEADLSFTSIPYWDKEEYGGQVISYKSLEDWLLQFETGLLTYSNLLINLPFDLLDEMKIVKNNIKEIFYLKNFTSHFNKREKAKLEGIIKLF